MSGPNIKWPTMPAISQPSTGVHLSGGSLYVNLVDIYPYDMDQYVKLGASVRDTGATLKLGEKKTVKVYNEGSQDEPAYEWAESQEITFETDLVIIDQNAFRAIFGNITTFTDNPTTLNLRRPFYFYSDSMGAANLPESSYLVKMPNAEISQAIDLKWSDEAPTVIKLKLTLHPCQEAGTLLGKKVEITKV